MEFKTFISIYINFRLRKNGFLNRGCSICSESQKEIFQAVLNICAQLERDARFSDVLTSFRKFGITKESFIMVLDQLLIGELNWMRVMSVVTLSGSLAVECMNRGEEHKIDLIEDWASSFADTKLRHWIERNGGLEGLLHYARQLQTPPEPHANHWERNLVIAGTVGVLVGLFVASKA